LSKPAATSAISNEYEVMSFLPFSEAVALNKEQAKIARIMVRAGQTEEVKTVKQAVHDTLLAAHEGEENFTVLTPDDILNLFDKFLVLATTMVSAIAAISLLVGGIGIMNIMLVTVTERTREIGLRKAVGATRGAILGQFLIEAIIVTLIGGLIGLGLAFLAGRLIAANSQLTPVFSTEVFVFTVTVSVVIGVIFGIWPAMRAAYKDPIEALRYE
jgi:putative ABC transport system permease protein